MRLCIIAIFCLTSFAYTASLLAANHDINSKIEQIKANVIFMRHALAPGYGDPEYFDINDCATQRNLNDEGRAQAGEIGAYFIDNNLVPDQIFTSQWCRCRDTATALNLGEWTSHEGLNSFFQGYVDRAQTLAKLEKLLDNIGENEIVLMVTHQVTIQAVTGMSVPSGSIVLYNSRTKKALSLHTM